MREAAMVLRKKYDLVHVPSRHKVDRWMDLARSLIADGYPPEQAGMEAARKVFSYEYHETRVFRETAVEKILEMNG